MDTQDSQKYTFFNMSYESTGKLTYLNMMTIDHDEAALRVFEMDGYITGMCALDKQPEDEMITVFAMGDKKIQKFKIGDIEVRKLNSKETIDLSLEKGVVTMYPYFNLMVTHSTDGKISVRNLLDKKKSVKEMKAHDAFTGGIVSMHLMDSGKTFVSIGKDGIFKFWKTKSSNVHRQSYVAFLDRKNSISVSDDALQRHAEMSHTFEESASIAVHDEGHDHLTDEKLEVNTFLIHY